MEKYFYEAIITPTNNGYFEARIPELDIITFGESLADAAFMAQDAMALRISSLLADGIEVKTTGSFSDIPPNNGTSMGIATYAESSHILENYMTVQDAADLLGVHRSRIHAMINDGRLRSSKSGNMRMVSTEDVMEQFNHPRDAGRPKKAAVV